MIDTNPNKPLQFGRVIYVEPNNNIVGGSKNTNFTFKPEDYSILVDLQVDVVDRYAYNGSGSDEIIQYTLEWDAKGTKTSLFKGTNGMLTTKALNTSFDDITRNLNQEAIGINSIDIRYNSWNYPEVTINFTDIRGASLLASADFIHSDVLPDEKKRIFTDNFANTFFSTFFRFPYPRYTLMVKGFYGRPVTYTLCVNDFKTRFNSSTGNFDVTVSFIGYMYGLLTDIPMRLLFVAPYCDYRGCGKEYWANKVASGDFTYEEGTNMITFFDLNEKIKCINANLSGMTEMVELMDEVKEYEDKKTALQSVQGLYYAYTSGMKELNLDLVMNGTEIQGRKYLFLFSDASMITESKCPMCGGSGHVLREPNTAAWGYRATVIAGDDICPACKGTGDKKRDKTVDGDLNGVIVEQSIDTKLELYNEITAYNSQPENRKIRYIPRIATDEEARAVLKGTIVYIRDEKSKTLGFVKPKPNDMAFVSVAEGDFEKVVEFLQSEEAFGTVNARENAAAVAVTVLRVDEFESDVNKTLAYINNELDLIAKKTEDVQNEVYTRLLGFKVSLKNVINMCLAHLDTFMQCMYECMDAIKGKHRLFSQARITKNESDVQATTEGEGRPGGSPLYLPPFFAFRKLNPKTGEYEDAWIGSDPRFSNRDIFQEIQLIDGLLNGTLSAEATAKALAEAEIGKKSAEMEGDELGSEYSPTFISDYYATANPYGGVGGNLESLIATFAFRCMIASVYGMDYPTIGNRFDAGDRQKKKYFENFAKNDAANFVKNTAQFKTFRDSSLPEIFSNLSWADFEKYITGQANEGGIIQNEHGHMYFTGSMANATPLFTRGGYSGMMYKNSYVISYGIEGEKAYVLPLMFTSASDAVTVANSIYEKCKSENPTPEHNGIGISRRCGFPDVEIISNDRAFCDDEEEIKAAFDSFSDHGKALQHVGWYFRCNDNWREYFAGPVQIGEDRWWFPSVVKLDNINDNVATNRGGWVAKNVRGNIYNGIKDKDGEEIFAYAPMEETIGVKKFYCEDGFFGKFFKFLFSTSVNKQNTVDGGKSNDNYIEKNVVPYLVGRDKSSVALIGLPCAQGTLFESEFYLMQNTPVPQSSVTNINNKTGKAFSGDEVKKYRKAFLFLHSLPTAEYGALSRVVETIIKRTYTPSVTDIPLASALFIGALYWRELVNGGSTEDDIFLCYNASGDTEYKQAKAGQLLTYSHGRTANSSRETTRRPLHPIKKDEKVDDVELNYLDVIDPIVASDFELKEKGLKGDDKLKSILEDNSTPGYRYVGFWDIPFSVKQGFIELFCKWVDNEFWYIENELSLRDPDGREITVEQVRALKEIFQTKVFNESGVATKEFNKAGYVIYKDKKDNLAYNYFIKSVFNRKFFDNHVKLGASNADDSLLTFLNWNSEVAGKLISLLSDGCTVKIPFPRVLMTRDMFTPDWDEERLSMEVSEDILKTAWETFKGNIMDAVNEKRIEDSQEEKAIQDVLPAAVTDSAKLSLYETLKNIHDKWLIATKREKYEFSRDGDVTPGGVSIGQNFYYINSFYEDVGDEIMLNIEQLPEQIDNVLENQNAANSLYSFMYDVANQSRTQLLALPVFNNLSDEGYVREMFSPIPYDELDSTKVYTETQYVFLYPEEASKQVSLSYDSKREEDRYKFADDSFTLVTESGLPNTKDIPNTFSKTKDNNGKTMRNVPVFGVTFAKQNQNFFKNVNVSMDSPKTTEVSIHNTLAVADKYNGANTQITALGQDLFPIYSNYSYECTVEMMGCACIMPLMYFQLNNMPMFKGTYIVYNVSHSITPGNMTTTFAGQRLSRYRKKRNEDALAGYPNDKALRTIKSNTEKSYDSIIDDCYTSSGYKLENEYVYDQISKNSGVTDKAALRAVEYAESHYTGGFFPDGKPKIYYDPWMARNRQISGEGLTVPTQFSENYVVANNYQDNMVRIARAAESLGEQTDENLAKASSCTITGAFGVPAELWEKCGAASLGEFFEKTGESFTCQGSYFAELLKNDDELRTSLQNKDWARFAKRYKGSGLTGYGVFCPGDNNNFTNYAKDLEVGYNEASGASSENYKKHMENNAKPILPEPVNDGNGRQLDVEKAVRYARSHAKTDSIGKCSTYVKNALQAGGIPYVTCNAAACQEEDFIKKDCIKIYDSKPGDYGVNGNGMNSHWERGDIVVIDNVGEHQYGHIAIWCGSQWVSDFKQTNCDIYTNTKRWKGDSYGPNMWNAGHFHFYRFKNRINV